MTQRDASLTHSSLPHLGLCLLIAQGWEEVGKEEQVQFGLHALPFFRFQVDTLQVMVLSAPKYKKCILLTQRLPET